ncbi:MAG: sodium ion-translocating decarboxylase subunit beta [Treponema sp.]|nr:sodium ion-translocating decarboxylase subunit beta [Treponema sp.]
MFNKNDPVFITKICLLIVCGVFVFSLVSAAFSPRVSAQTTDPTEQSGIIPGSENIPHVSLGNFFSKIIESTGIYAFITDRIERQSTEFDEDAGVYKTTTVYGWQTLLMVAIGFVLIYLAVGKKFEPLILIPIGFGTIFANIPFAGMAEPGGFLDIIYRAGIGNTFFPLLIFMGVGAMTDFGPLIANPKTAILGAAAQFGIFGALFFVSIANYIPGVDFNLLEACAIAIIGGADGPTAIYIAQTLADHLLATIAVAAYTYMALVPIIQPPIMRLLTTKAERRIRMKQLRDVSQKEKMLFPLVVFALSVFLLPSAAPLVGAFMLGNFFRECKVADRLSDTAQNALINIVSILLSLGIGSRMTPERFLNPSSLIIIGMGLIAFMIGTASGVMIAKFMNLFLKEKINPLIGSAGVSAVPMAARVSNKVGLEEDPGNFLLMHAMGPNVAGVIGSAIAAGVMIAIYGG